LPRIGRVELHVYPAHAHAHLRRQLSHSHVGWPVVDEAIAVSERKAPIVGESFVQGSWPPPSPPACAQSSGQLIRQRLSAVDFDGVTSITGEKCLAILDTASPRAFTPPFDAWPFSPRIHLVLFDLRVKGLDRGMYLWLRAPAEAEALRHSFHDVPAWEVLRARPPWCHSGV
jgi:hypothetical protein